MDRPNRAPNGGGARSEGGDAGARVEGPGRGIDTLREINVVREARRQLPTSLRLNAVLGVMMVAILLAGATCFYFTARIFGVRLGEDVLVAGAISCLVALLASLLFLRLYLGPIVEFAEEILQKFQELTGTLEARVLERTAALAQANTRLRGSLDENRNMQQQISDASRRAGMADVATSVIHNVGNVLNSVNVSAGLVMEKVAEARVGALTQVATLLRQEAERGELGRFFKHDERGRRLPEYLTALAAAAESDKQVILAELSSLQANIDHIKAVIGRQQMQAKAALAVLESVSLGQLCDEALKLALSSGATIEGAGGRRTVKIVRHYAEMPRARLDRHKLFEALTNLLGNAKSALEAGVGVPEPSLTVTTNLLEGARVSIEVTDNGCGIAPENLTRIFTFGFSTKAGGHGFGLHASALAMGEMGGSLTAQSAGVGQGATFRIELPLRASHAGDANDLGAMKTPPPEPL